MGGPRTQWPVVGSSWIIRLIPIIGLVVLYRTIAQDVYVMRSRSSFIATVAASLARHGKTTSIVDLSWHAPNATSINDLSQVINGTGVYGFIYNGSSTSENEYGVYNWCNMPHVRPTEYKRASSEYKLQYVEVVCQFCPIYSIRLLIDNGRFTGITNAQYMLVIPFPLNPMAGTVMMRRYFIMDSRRLEGSLHTYTGLDILALQTLSSLQDS
jgi:hypothetical protein